MKVTPFVVGLAMGGAGLLLVAAPLAAHHSFAAEFHLDQKATVVGTITKMDFRNPHSWLYIDAKDEKGEVQSWSIEFGAANSLYRRGWRREDLPIGMTVTVTGFMARDGSRTLGAPDVKFPDGRTLFGGNAPAEGR